MRTISFAGLCLISAIIALAELPDGPSLLVHWPRDIAAAAAHEAEPDRAQEAAALQSVDAAPATADAVTAVVAGSLVAEAVTVLALDRPMALGASSGRVQTADIMKSMPSGATAVLPPRPAHWPTPPRPVACPFSSAAACAAWRHGR